MVNFYHRSVAERDYCARDETLIQVSLIVEINSHDLLFLLVDVGCSDMSFVCFKQIVKSYYFQRLQYALTDSNLDEASSDIDRTRVDAFVYVRISSSTKLYSELRQLSFVG